VLGCSTQLGCFILVGTDWIEPVIGDVSKAHCRVCDVDLFAHSGCLERHAKTQRHKNLCSTLIADGKFHCITVLVHKIDEIINLIPHLRIVYGSLFIWGINLSHISLLWFVICLQLLAYCPNVYIKHHLSCRFMHSNGYAVCESESI
jgi:hypothetical protein